jgi:GT2 family glycosyltransferase
MLAETLTSLSKQTAEFEYAVVVVDNDAVDQAGLAIGQSTFNSGHLKGLCVIEPRQGNVHAINTGFVKALDFFPGAEWILMIDDDEVASPGWLHTMVQAADETGADIVGGPVVPYFQSPTSPAIQRHPVFWPAYTKNGFVPLIYGSGNCLIRRRVFDAVREPYFDARFNFLGGGDTDFFHRCRLLGFCFYFAQDALITETVPADRAKPNWIMKRGLRIGAINRAIDSKAMRRRPASGLRVAAKDLAILIAAPWRALHSFFTTRQTLTALLPILIALGRIGSAFGAEPQQYRLASSAATKVESTKKAESASSADLHQ